MEVEYLVDTDIDQEDDNVNETEEVKKKINKSLLL